MKNANPVSRCGGVLAACLIAVVGCNQPRSAESVSVPALPANVASGAHAGVVRYTYEVVKAWPHDRGAFTQGLVFRGDTLLESTGLNGESSLREVNIADGRVLKRVQVPAAYFAEGLAVIGTEAFQLTWQNRKAFVYDADTFRELKQFSYEGEGWGLATDGALLILSDGSARIRFLDPATFAVKRTIDVTLDGKPVERLNELEYIRGELFANVWQTDEIVRIDPKTGQVRGVIDFSGLLSPQERTPDTDVLNGIAYDEKSDRLFVTGKRWPRLFEVRLKVRR